MKREENWVYKFGQIDINQEDDRFKPDNIYTYIKCKYTERKRSSEFF